MGVLDGKVAIVTGAGKGLGVGEAMALAREGAAVVVVARTFSDVQETARKVEAVGSQALALRCDVTKLADVEHVVRETVKRFGQIDILVNNAQSTYADHPLEEWTEEEMEVTWRSGPMGSWYFSRACFPYLKINGGRIINFASPAGHGRTTGYVGYSMAKEAIRALTRISAREWGRYGITVNTISPAAMSDFVANYMDTEEKTQAIFDKLGFVLRELGDPELDIGRSVVFLAGPDAKHITGCTLSVDCGCAML